MVSGTGGLYIYGLISVCRKSCYREVAVFVSRNLNDFNDYFSKLYKRQGSGSVVYTVKILSLTNREAGANPAGSTARQKSLCNFFYLFTFALGHGKT